MEIIVFIIWIISLVFLGIAAFYPPRSFNILAVGLFALDLWLGLQFLMEQTDPLRF